MLTHRPIQARFPSGSALCALNLASTGSSPDRSTKSTRSHAHAHAPAACRHRVSGSLSLPSRGPFHLSFTVLYAIGHCRYLALRGGPRAFPLGSSCPVVLRHPPACALAPRTGLSPPMAGLPSAVPLAATPGITFVFSSSGYLDVSVRRVPPTHTMDSCAGT